MRVLIAEDDLTSRLLLESVLKDWGYEVVLACDGDEAWAILQDGDAPKLVILDWMMPGMEGVEICRRLRQRAASDSTHIILLTSRGRKEDIVHGLEAGANDYITKPFDNDELRARIQVGRKLVELQTALADRVRELQEALSQIKTLQGILPICMHCHKIRTDQESWQRLDSYVQEHTEAQFSHGLCPECLEKHYPKPGPGEVDDDFSSLSSLLDTDGK